VVAVSLPGNSENDAILIDNSQLSDVYYNGISNYQT